MVPASAPSLPVLVVPPPSARPTAPAHGMVGLVVHMPRSAAPGEALATALAVFPRVTAGVQGSLGPSQARGHTPGKIYINYT